jgi:hypothetical protein
MNEMNELPPPPPFPGANRRLLVPGAYVSPEQRIRIFSPAEFEVYARQWADGYLRQKTGRYVRIDGAPGAGDKGRDLVAWIDPDSATPRRWDCYQSKHYAARLTPTDVYIELGKLCFYTFRGDYTVPESYFLVPSLGIGQKLADLIEKPADLRAELIRNWEKYCRDDITASPVVLEGEFRAYVEAFDFSIVRSVTPEEMLDQHRQTAYHAVIFGMAIKDRPAPDKPPVDVQTHETRYVGQVLEAFGDHLKTPTPRVEDVAREDLREVFRSTREAFYCAESLRRFARETLPPEAPYDAILDEFCDGLEPVTLDPTHTDGLVRMISTTKHATQLQMSEHLLKGIITPKDRVGICHQLANNDRVVWVPKSGS